MPFPLFTSTNLPDDPMIRQTYALARQTFKEVAKRERAVETAQRKGWPNEESAIQAYKDMVDGLKILLALPDLEYQKAVQLISLALGDVACETAMVFDLPQKATIEKKLTRIFKGTNLQGQSGDTYNLDKMMDLSGIPEEGKILAALGLLKYAAMAERWSAGPVRDALAPRVRQQSASIAPGTIPDTLHLMMTKAAQKLEMK